MIEDHARPGGSDVIGCQIEQLGWLPSPKQLHRAGGCADRNHKPGEYSRSTAGQKARVPCKSDLVGGTIKGKPAHPQRIPAMPMLGRYMPAYLHVHARTCTRVHARTPARTHEEGATGGNGRGGIGEGGSHEHNKFRSACRTHPSHRPSPALRHSRALRGTQPGTSQPPTHGGF